MVKITLNLYYPFHERYNIYKLLNIYDSNVYIHHLFNWNGILSRSETKVNWEPSFVDLTFKNSLSLQKQKVSPRGSKHQIPLLHWVPLGDLSNTIVLLSPIPDRYGLSSNTLIFSPETQCNMMGLESSPHLKLKLVHPSFS